MQYTWWETPGRRGCRSVAFGRAAAYGLWSSREGCNTTRSDTHVSSNGTGIITLRRPGAQRPTASRRARAGRQHNDSLLEFIKALKHCYKLVVLYGSQSGTGAGLLRVLPVSLPILIPPTAPYSSIICGWYNRSTSARHTKWSHSYPNLRKWNKKFWEELLDYFHSPSLEYLIW
jgi:hypothetical protein